MSTDNPIELKGRVIPSADFDPEQLDRAQARSLCLDCGHTALQHMGITWDSPESRAWYRDCGSLLAIVHTRCHCGCEAEAFHYTDGDRRAFLAAGGTFSPDRPEDRP